MDKIRCMVVDDEPLAIEILEEYIGKVPWLSFAESFDKGVKAIEYINNNEVDLLFLDIQMPDLSGIQVAQLISKKCDIVFTTAYHQYAVEGFELEAKDYLLKPISFERFLKSVQRIKGWQEQLQKEKEDFVFVKTEYKTKKIRLSDILYIEGMKDYLRIVTSTEKVMILQSFSKLLPTLPSSRFSRVHKSFVIALDAIDIIEKSKVKIKEAWIPIGESYKEDFLGEIQRRTV
ncbi:response regulator transcription factor [Roseivirga sp.]|uniref:LytR/AlgR family response regulator transcription factor n=1 Tax=Roseivirga sp. TaxID=1964215 RepID=UPI002B267BDD|nr:response regulator transcription factor [Roseivirga sp.]